MGFGGVACRVKLERLLDKTWILYQGSVLISTPQFQVFQCQVPLGRCPVFYRWTLDQGQDFKIAMLIHFFSTVASGFSAPRVSWVGRGHSVVHVTMLADKQSLLISSLLGSPKELGKYGEKDEETGRERPSGC